MDRRKCPLRTLRLDDAVGPVRCARCVCPMTSRADCSSAGLIRVCASFAAAANSRPSLSASLGISMSAITYCSDRTPEEAMPVKDLDVLREEVVRYVLAVALADPLGADADVLPVIELESVRAHFH